MLRLRSRLGGRRFRCRFLTLEEVGISRLSEAEGRRMDFGAITTFFAGGSIWGWCVRGYLEDTYSRK